MGHPRKHRKKYSGPSHPWQRSRIEKERTLLRSYGLKNKKELWKMESLLKSFKEQAKSLIVRTNEQSKKEEKLLIDRLHNLGLVEQNAKIDDILDLDLADILKRRLETMVFNKGLAKTPKQARQFIIHGHIFVNNKEINVPSYLVKRAEENIVVFSPTSPFITPDHIEIVKKKSERKIIEVKPLHRRGGRIDRTRFKRTKVEEKAKVVVENE